MYVTEFTLRAKPGHFEQLAEIHSEFAADFLSDHPALETVMVVGDEASGVVRGIGVYTDREAADEVNATPSSRPTTTGSSRCWQAHRAGRATALAPLLALSAAQGGTDCSVRYFKSSAFREREGRGRRW